MSVCDICRKKFNKAVDIEYLREKFLGNSKAKVGPTPKFESRNGKIVTITG